MPEDPLTWHDVFKEELGHVASRHVGATPVAENLVGLAVSGGGIRSATFGLGVLETLKRLDLLKQIDYLSTVSGGGYIGAWLSANCHRAGRSDGQALPTAAVGTGKAADEAPADTDKAATDARNAARPGWLDPRADWSQSVGHLRRYSNYLSPQVGFLSADTWSMGAIWIRNTLLVQLTVILAIATVLLLPRLLFRLFTFWPDAGDLRWVSVACFIVAVVGIAGNQLRLNGAKRTRWLSAGAWKTGVAPALFFFFLAIGVGLLGGFAPFADTPMNRPVAFAVSACLLASAFFAQPFVVKVVGLFWAKDKRPKEINYTQGWVQAVVVAPMMAAGFCLAAVLWGQSISKTHPLAAVHSFGDLFRQASHHWPLPLSVAFASLWLLSLVSLRNFRWWSLALAAFAPVPVVLVLHALLVAVALLLHHWAAFRNEGQWHAFVWAPALVLYVFALTVNILIGMLSRQSSESVREWWSRFGAWLGIYGFGWMLMTLSSVYGPRLGLALLSWEHPWQSLSTVAGWLATTVVGLLAGNSDASGGAKVAGAERTAFQKVTTAIALVGPFVFIGGLLVAISTALHLIVLSGSLDTLPSMKELHLNYWRYLNQADLVFTALVLALVAGSTLLLVFRVDINEFSLNAFYRNRLARCYLGATRRPDKRTPQNFTGFDEGDDFSVACLAAAPGKPAAGPVHLVNCALNLGGSSDLALHTRRSASFTISPYATGSTYASSHLSRTGSPIGYRRTCEYGGKGGQTTLAQAISVSGAAASPNMGYHTSAVVAFLLTLFNVRLGWWFPSPARPIRTKSSPWFSLRYLLAELFGGADDKSKYLMISDGGHFENLGAYELVRRKCRVIIISDAECDPRLQFSSLGSLIRMCEVDFGAHISIDLKPIGVGDSKWSTRSFAIGCITYADETPGVLIYLKASLTEAGDSAVRQYKASHPTFPHESTGDQFYGEDQFESYRRLGREVADEAFKPAETMADATFIRVATAFRPPVVP